MSTGDTSERTVSRNFFKLGLGEVFARLITFAATIYIARVLGPESYGIVGFALAITLYFSLFTDFGIEDLGPRELARNPARIRDLAPSLVAARTLIAIVCATGLAVFSWAFLPQPDAAVLAACGLTLLPVGLGVRWVFFGIEKMGRVALARGVGEMLRLLLVIVLVKQSTDIARVPLAQFLGEMLAALLLLWWARQHGFRFGWRIDWQHIRPLFRRARSLMLTALLALIIYNSDLVILRMFRPVDEIGLYLAAYTLIALLANLGHAYCASLLPTLSRLDAGSSDAQQLYDTALAHMFTIVLPLAVGGCLLGKEIIQLSFGAGFAPSGVLLQILIWCVPFLLLRSVLRAALIARGCENRVFQMTAWAAGLNIVLNFIAIPVWGMLGAAVTTVLTEALRMLLAYLYVRAEGYRGTGIQRFWRSMVATAAMSAALLLLPMQTLWVSLALGIGVYFLALGLAGGIRLQRNGLPVLTV
jgi:O-antigen/teichoic acid export membrane protein